jgi:phosphoglycolate phosphatase
VLLLCDLDGTLVDSFADIRGGIAAACAEVGLAAEEAVLSLARRGWSLEDIFAAARGEPGHFDRFAGAYREHYLPRCTETTRPFPEVAETLRTLRDRGVTIAVATTKRTETAKRVLEETGLAPLIDACVGATGLPPKPDPAVLRAAAAAVGHDVTRAVMVGDTDKDVLAARAAKCRVAAVTYGGFTEAELTPLAPDWILQRFSGVLSCIVGT